MPPALKAKAGCRVRAPGAAAERLVPLCAVCQSSPGFPERCLYTISSPASPRTASPDPPCGSHPLPSLDCLRESAILLYHILVFLQCTFTGKIFYFLPYLAILAPTGGKDLGETRLGRLPPMEKTLERPALEGSHRWRRPWRDPPLKERPVPPNLPRPDLPGARPPSMHTVLQNTVCPGACAGEFLLGAVGWTIGNVQ